MTLTQIEAAWLRAEAIRDNSLAHPNHDRLRTIHERVEREARSTYGAHAIKQARARLERNGYLRHGTVTEDGHAALNAYHAEHGEPAIPDEPFGDVSPRWYHTVGLFGLLALVLLVEGLDRTARTLRQAYSRTTPSE